MSLPGSGVLRGTGVTTKLSITLGGSGDAELEQFVAREVHAIVRSGRIVVTASNSLDASVEGDGAVIYYGRPPHLTTNITGNGAILHGNL